MARPTPFSFFLSLSRMFRSQTLEVKAEGCPGPLSLLSVLDAVEPLDAVIVLIEGPISYISRATAGS